jgi:hypothetical protein
LVAQGEVALAPDEGDSDSDSESDDARESAEEEPDRTTLVGVPAPDLGMAGFRGVAGSEPTPSAADVQGADLGVEALATERVERDLAELNDAHAEDDMADTLAGIGAPNVEADDEAVEHDADGGEPERSAVVRKPRAPVSRDDLDWADILVPEPEPDAEDGS